jgi:serine/threonine protein kinase
MARKAFHLVKGVHVPGTKWLLVREIARGGMGVTWEVVKHPGIRGVMKMILPDLAARSSYVRRFLEEVEILTKLNHPNIVQVFDFDTLEDGTPFFVMERLEGKTLGAAMIGVKNGVRVRKAFPARVAYEITRQTCEALYRAHSLQPKGVIHRDLKPENIYIHHASFGGEPVIKLLDFGVAAFEQAARESGPVGTPRYMAPEQLRCDEITPKADLYAMGLVLYEMLVGRGPFDDLANAVEPNDRALVLVNAHLNEAPPPPSRYAPWIPQTINSLVLSALDKDPENRPISAYALVAKLFELQFVNDGTPREAVDGNTTAPTLVKIIEDDEPADEPRREAQPTVRERAALPNDTAPDVVAPAVGKPKTVERSVDPFGHTAPRPPDPMKPGIDREAATRFRNTVPRRRVPQNDTEPMVQSIPRQVERAMRAPAAAPAQPDATPLTSEMPTRAAADRGDRERAPSQTPSERRRRRRALGLRLAALLVITPAIGAGVVFGIRRLHRPGVAESNLRQPPSPVVTVVASESLARAPASLPSPPPAVEPVPPPSLVPVVESPVAAPSVSATASAARAKVPVAKPPSAKPATSKPSGGVAADDGRDLLYVPPPPRQP